MIDTHLKVATAFIISIFLLIVYYGFFDIKKAEQKKEAAKNMSICVENAKTQKDTCNCAAKYIIKK